MSRPCQVTGRKGRSGNRISHSHRRTKRRFEPNTQSKRYWVPSLGRHVRLDLTPAGMRVIDRLGIDAVVADLRARGEVA
ncbi:50S ribosomal protein L28 [Quadrisphaera sp. INWT6]|uniref:50S ribosomal protein L28 n=1 Tax=Quadrisphaera sp. INWT6 TaxID=2596917 RepID=UPI0018921C4C|nr:50S ribosomal protein L28 [Quadrisphaera sp. INWT6]MBF5081320.1 50S ribosomal protein L28 [Quadrisphaera sp. INWT6]